MSKKDSCENVDSIKGGLIVELDEGLILHVKKGKLKICTCVEKKWECTSSGNDTICKDVCFVWSCKEISPNGAVKKALSKELLKK